METFFQASGKMLDIRISLKIRHSCSLISSAACWNILGGQGSDGATAFTNLTICETCSTFGGIKAFKPWPGCRVGEEG